MIRSDLAGLSYSIFFYNIHIQRNRTENGDGESSSEFKNHGTGSYLDVKVKTVRFFSKYFNSILVHSASNFLINQTRNTNLYVGGATLYNNSCFAKWHCRKLSVLIFIVSIPIITVLFGVEIILMYLYAAQK